MALHVIELTATGGRAVVDADALPDWLERGFTDCGITTDRTREPVLSDAELAAANTPTKPTKRGAAAEKEGN